MERRDLLRRLLVGLATLGVLGEADRLAAAAQMLAAVPPTGAGADALAEVQRGIWLRHHLADPEELYRLLSGFGSVLRSAAEQHGGARPEFVRLYAFHDALAGLVAYTAGDRGIAGVHLTASRHNAQSVHDRRLEALALLWGSDLASHVQRGLAGPSPAAVLQALKLAATLSAEGPAALRGYVGFRLAEEFAATGQPGAAQRALEWAREALAQPDSEGLFGRPWPIRVSESFRGNVALLSGMPGMAEAILRPIVAGLPADARTRDGGVSSDGIAAMGDLAAALARQGELDEACQLLGNAWELARDTSMDDRAARLRAIRLRELDGYRAAPAVVRLDERVGWTV
jgi:hypothetical protein